MDERDGMRAADADRQAVADRLRVALDEGRLDLHEYDERLQRTYTARTYGELDAVVIDLPVAAAPGGATVAGPVPADPVVPGRSTAGRSVTARWLAENWEPYLTAVGISLVVWAMISVISGDVLYFWPGWVAGPWGVVLLVQTGIGLSTGEPQRWAEKQERKRVRKAEKRARRRELKAERRALGREALPEAPAISPPGDDPQLRPDGWEHRRDGGVNA
ncbi:MULTISPECIES: DUF1707 SHOCT-like domain-containing protein [Micromonospora]|uniref:DUF1707 domain-containing protein n=1 Tax=Micromonospora yangpuensis TaxID=683228 RepID=A0A1C6VBB3_9ACTN|nr:DUF1707 domain-containing protein [Micromonospora yangpuensis]GGM23096.1 hypothetical protein GCM10012279_46690 [Micromonospora yangpuensis]SCL63354.1 protein of unknown function [Micromonospora yangpuensis]